MMTALFLVLGFALLWKGGDWLVEGADRFARSHGMPATLAGVFILGFGTSVPELAVSSLAAYDGEAGIAAGNVVGSNICNVGLVLGATALIAGVAVRRSLLRIEMPVCIGASVLAFVLMLDGFVTWTDGLILLACFGAYAAYAAATRKRREQDLGERPPRRPLFDMGQAVLGMAAVIGGAKLFKDGAVDAAEALGASQTVIGLTLVALGTSLPELATAIAAARKRKPDLIVGNVIGSNIFNLLMVLGVAGVLRTQDVEDRLPQLDVPFMVGLALVPLVLGFLGGRVGRRAGAGLLVAYLVYLTLFPHL